MMKYKLIATTTFGIEAICKRELISLGFEIISTENGKVTFYADEVGIVKANLWLRTADRVLLVMDEFTAYTFDELFDKVNNIDWGSLIPKDGNFIVNGKSVKSKLFSIRDCQSIIKKSISKKLMDKYEISWLEETGALYSVLFSILKDVVTITVDTSGLGLHKRGYRVKTVTAPMKETLAASLVLLSYWSKDRILYDPFCGSGTIPIEAAMIGRNIAPGLNRDFAAKSWDIIDPQIWKDEAKKAYQAIDLDTKIQIFASDIDEENLEAAKENAIEAGVDDCIDFSLSDFKDVKYENNYGVLICNPPYGERLEDEKAVQKLYGDMGKVFIKLDTWSKYVITSYVNFEGYFRKKSDRQRKLYNGRIETRYYQYYGPRPPLKE
ncbi:RNA methyltransferase [Candidatus Izimaplasma bacterium ZiA1]|uniref:THUMP domain-containing class I SAM-dependent RNA methyltransferase n=1 Tax=Candidatus Izimoplasma sp. ZiA1 TaxID=2024899 RepID=UPI000BAA586D|nr:RNA methyltransferase [Candidatus Izimaplasma bacterium ZiA1]